MPPLMKEHSEPSSIIELSREENKIRIEEEQEVEQKRRAAQKAAVEQGLIKEEPVSLDGTTEIVKIEPASANVQKPQQDEEDVAVTSRPSSIPSRKSSGSGPEPFPEFSTEDEPDFETPEPP